MSNKLKNTRIVTVKKDFKTAGGKVVLAKGSEHAMHHVTAARLKARGADLDVKTLDIEKVRADARKNFAAREKQRASSVWS